MFFCQFAFAAPSREAGNSDASPVVLYGKTSGGVLTAVQVDSNGVIQIEAC